MGCLLNGFPKHMFDHYNGLLSVIDVKLSLKLSQNVCIYASNHFDNAFLIHVETVLQFIKITCYTSKNISETDM